MKKAILPVLILIAVLALAGGRFYYSRGVQAVSVRINIKDLSEQGLVIIGSSDPSFERKISVLLKGKANPLIQGLKPFAVLIENRTNKTVVGYELKWEMMKADGTVVSRNTGGANPGALMGGGPPGLENTATMGGAAIRPHSTRFVSTTLSFNEDDGGVRGLAFGSSDPSDTKSLEEAARDKRIDAILDSLNAELQDYLSITVSIDGAFFDDGTFIGPNTTQFFEKIQAAIDANYDLLNEIAFAKNRKISAGEIFGDIEKLADDSDDFSNDFITITDHYNYCKKVYAKSILQMRKAKGDERALAVAVEPLRKKWIRLKKL